MTGTSGSAVDRFAAEPLTGTPMADRLLRISLELAAELWVVRQRLELLERQLVDRQLCASLDDLPPRDDAQREADRKARQEAVERLFGVLVD